MDNTTEIIYGYTLMKKQKRPTTTVAVVVRDEGDAIRFGIGVAECAVEDFPVKAYGRSLAIARANGALDRQGRDIVSAYDAAGDVRILGISVLWEDAHVAIQDLELDLAVTTRVGRALTYLRNKHSK
jgi:hypothetical protein